MRRADCRITWLRRDDASCILRWMPFVTPPEMRSIEPLPGWRGRFFHSENMTFAIYDVDADAVPIHEHQHPQEEVWNIVSGKVAVSIDGAERILGPGEAAIVPSNAPHHARAITSSRAIVVDYPLRLQLPGTLHSA